MRSLAHQCACTPAGHFYARDASMGRFALCWLFTPTLESRDNHARPTPAPACHCLWRHLVRVPGHRRPVAGGADATRVRGGAGFAIDGVAPMGAGRTVLFAVRGGAAGLCHSPGLRARRGRTAAALGALLGLLAYGTYDLSNYATLRDWPLGLTVIDMAWGSVLSAISATAGYLAASRLRR